MLKAFLTGLRFTLRPINNMIIKKFRTADHNSKGHRFFVWFGNYANMFEVKLNRWLLGSKGLGSVSELHPDVAFNKGIDWFTEVFFFYGILFTIAGYEIWKAEVASKKLNYDVVQLLSHKQMA